MEVKKAIEFLDDIYDWNTAPDIEEKVEENIPEIISLLQQGEAYKKMWEELTKDIKQVNYVQSNNGLERLKLFDQFLALMELIKQKYFPKEAKNGNNPNR